MAPQPEPIDPVETIAPTAAKLDRDPVVPTLADPLPEEVEVDHESYIDNFDAYDFESTAESAPDLQPQQAQVMSEREAREEDLFSSAGVEGPSEVETLEERMDETLTLKQDTLAIGGMMFLRFEYASITGVDSSEQPLTSPNLVDVYLDARPTQRLRAYARGRVRNDFIRQDDGDAALPTVRTAGTGTLDPSSEATSVQLDQLWLKFDIDRTVYITVGRQPLRWGTGRFWNPTDFLNRQFRDPLAVFDERLGIGLVKAHLPLEGLGWNLYAIGEFEQAANSGGVGGALRGEFLAGPAELSVTAAYRRDEPFQLGADLSAGLGPFELRAEAAFSYDDAGPFLALAGPGQNDLIAPTFRNVAGLLEVGLPPSFRAAQLDRTREWISRATLGAELEMSYNDQDSAFLGVEYFFNGAGVRNAQLLPALVILDAYEPLYAGRNYVAGYLALPSPGSWNRSNLSFSTVANLSDQSLLSRFDFSTELFSFATFNMYASMNYGQVGELRFQYELDGVSDSVSVSDPMFLADLPPSEATFASVLLNGVSINAPRFNVGFGFRVDL
ncbi:MAG: hypothetical protein AAF654_05890 [Myxococcota bacterium]